MRREYLNQYSHTAKTPKMLLCNIYRTLLGDESAPPCAAQGKIDKVLHKLLLVWMTQILYLIYVRLMEILAPLYLIASGKSFKLT